MRPKTSSSGNGVGAPGARGLIRIEAGSGPVVRSNGKTDPYTFWMGYFNTKELKYSSPREREKIVELRTDPEHLRDVVRLLNSSGKSQDVHAALLGYLTHNPSKAESWMYRALAGAIELIHGPDAEVKTALGYAADLAQRSHNPNDLVAVADMLIVRGYFGRVGPLLDEAMAKVPHRGEPILMAMKLAEKTRDPRRMADAVERLLSLGWPGMDDYVRAETRNQVETLATSLRELGSPQAADTLRARLVESEARDLYVRLTWDGEADFDLAVSEPLGVTASYQLPRTVFGGALVKNGYGSHPEEVYVCPRAFDGDYQIGVSTIWTNPDKPVTRLTLEIIAHEGTAQEQKQVHNLIPDKPQKPFVVHLTAGRRKTVLPYFDPVATVLEELDRARKRAKPKPPARRSVNTLTPAPTSDK